MSAFRKKALLASSSALWLVFAGVLATRWATALRSGWLVWSVWLAWLGSTGFRPSWVNAAVNGVMVQILLRLGDLFAGYAGGGAAAPKCCLPAFLPVLVRSGRWGPLVLEG